MITASGAVRAGMFVSKGAATLNQAPADANAVLAGLRTLDLSTATVAADPAAPRHWDRPRDFHLAFGLGADDSTIAPADMAGVALAAVKALDARVTAPPSGSQGTPGAAGATGPRGPGRARGSGGPGGTRRPGRPLAGRAAREAQQAPRDAWPGSSVRSESCSRAATTAGACRETGCTSG